MATTGTAVVSMRLAESGMAGAMAYRPSACALYLNRAPGLSLVASPRHSSARFNSILSSASSRTSLNVLAIHALDPDFYKIPYVEGIPVGKKLKLWNLPPDCKHSELMEWFTGIDVTVDSLEFTNDPTLNAQGIGGFVEFATKQQACIAIVRLDGYKFRGHCIRMDFAEKRPHPRDYGSRRNSPNRSSNSSSSSRGSFATPSRPPVTDMIPSYGGATSANAQSTPMYEVANTMDVQASSEYQSSIQSGYHSTSGNGERIPSSPTYGNVQPPSAYSSTSSSTGYGAAQSLSGHGSAPSSLISGGTPSVASAAAQSAPLTGYGSAPGYGNGLTQSPLSHAPSAPGIEPSPSHGNGPVSGGTQPSTIQYNPSNARIYSSHENSHQVPGYNGAESSYSQLNGGQSASAPLAPAPSYGNSSMQPVRSDGANRSSPAPSYGNSGMLPVRSSGERPMRSDGTNMGSSDTWAAPTYGNKSPQGNANYGVDKSQTSYSSQSSSSSNSLDHHQYGPALDKSIPPSYVNSSPQPASSVEKSTTLSSSSYGSIKNNKSDSNYGVSNNNKPGSDYGNRSLSSYGDRSPPFVDKSITQSSSSYGSIGSQQPSSYVSTPPPSKSSEAQPYSTTQAAPSAYGGTAAVNNVRSSVRSPGSQGPFPSSSYANLDLYEDAFKNYGVPDAAELEPWSKDTNFRSGPMYGSPQPSSLNRLFVGNLALSIDDATVQELFSRFGTVLEARVLRDQESGRSRGFGVVAMSSVDEVKAASEALDGWRVESRPLKVNAVAFKH